MPEGPDGVVMAAMISAHDRSDRRRSHPSSTWFPNLGTAQASGDFSWAGVGVGVCEWHLGMAGSGPGAGHQGVAFLAWADIQPPPTPTEIISLDWDNPRSQISSSGHGCA
jgi:hypothetical protein